MHRLILVLSLIELGLVAGCGGGSTTPAITSSAGGPVVLKSIQITPAKASIAQGTTQAFTATGEYSDGSTKDLTTTAQWTCVIPNLATVGNTSPIQGVASGIGTGTAVITAALGSVSNSAQLTVTGATVSTLTVTPARATLGFGNPLQFTATATFSDLSKQDVTNVATWFSSLPFVTSNSGLAIGQALTSSTFTDEVTALFGGTIANATLTVDLSNLVSVSVVPSSTSIANNTQGQFAAIGTFDDGSTRDLSSLALWSASGQALVFPGAQPGSVSAITTGAATITATIGIFNPTSRLTVTAAQLQSIVVLPANATIAPTAKLPVTAIGVFSDSSTQDLTGQVTWSVLDNSVASVSSTERLVTGKSQGSTTLTAKSSAALGFIQGSSPLHVTSATLDSIALTPASLIITPGRVLTFSGIGTFSDGSVADITALAKWTSDSPSVASIASSTVTGQGIGSSTIKARVGILSGTANLAVASPKQISLAMTPSTIQLAGQTSTQLRATGTFIDGSTQDFTSLVNWSSSAPNVATIGYQTGTVSGLSAGQSTITATLGPISATGQLTVTNASLRSVTISPANPTIASATSQQLAATETFSDGTTQNLLGGNWISSAPGVAVVNASGVVTGIAPGTASISAELNGTSGTTTVTVH